MEQEVRNLQLKISE